MVNDDRFVSQRGRSKHALWMLLCDITSKHPGEVTSLRVDPVLRSGIHRFTDEVGRLWCALAEYYVRQGAFEKVRERSGAARSCAACARDHCSRLQARDVYEEAITEVVTVRDFATVYDAYVQVGFIARWTPVGALCPAHTAPRLPRSLCLAVRRSHAHRQDADRGWSTLCAAGVEFWSHGLGLGGPG